MKYTTFPQAPLPSSLASSFHQGGYYPGEVWSLTAQWEPAIGNKTPMSGPVASPQQTLGNLILWSIPQAHPTLQGMRDLEDFGQRPPFLLIFFYPQAPKHLSARDWEIIHALKALHLLLFSRTLGAVALFQVLSGKGKTTEKGETVEEKLQPTMQLIKW